MACPIYEVISNVHTRGIEGLETYGDMSSIPGVQRMQIQRSAAEQLHSHYRVPAQLVCIRKQLLSLMEELRTRRPQAAMVVLGESLTQSNY